MTSETGQDDQQQRPWTEATATPQDEPMRPASHRFRALWPILDEQRTWNQLLQEAARELPLVAARAHARIVGPTRWTIAPSAYVPGSGHTTDQVLICDAPAEPHHHAAPACTEGAA